MNPNFIQHFKGKSILLIDDDELLTSITGRVLVLMGFNVFSINDPRKIYHIYKPDVFDVILLDMKMPYLSGNEVEYIIRKISPSQKIIIASGFAENKSPCKVYLSKPYNTDELFNVLEKQLGENEEWNEQQMQKKKG